MLVFGFSQTKEGSKSPTLELTSWKAEEALEETERMAHDAKSLNLFANSPLYRIEPLG